METLSPETQETPTKPIPLQHSIFFGPDGLRAGWSILVYVAITVGLLFLLGLEVRWFARHTHQAMAGKGSGDVHPTIAIATETVALLAVVLATAFMGWIEHRRVAFYGLAGGGRARQFLIGLVSGFGFLSLLAGILVATHHLELHRVSMPTSTAVAYGATWALFFFLVGMTEELMLRGYLLFTLARGIRFWPAAILLAMLFGFLHKGNPGESPIGLVAAALIALVFSLSLWRLGHLWWAIGFHTAWDWAESYFYGTPDSGMMSAGRLMNAHPSGALMVSGGTTGPEGSVWILLIVILAALFVWATQPYRGIHLAENPNTCTPQSI